MSEETVKMKAVFGMERELRGKSIALQLLCGSKLSIKPPQHQFRPAFRTEIVTFIASQIKRPEHQSPGEQQQQIPNPNREHALRSHTAAAATPSVQSGREAPHHCDACEGHGGQHKGQCLHWGVWPTATLSAQLKHGSLCAALAGIFSLFTSFNCCQPYPSAPWDMPVLPPHKEHALAVAMLPCRLTDSSNRAQERWPRAKEVWGR